MIFLAVLFAYTMRVCLHIAIVEISVPIQETKEDIVDACPHLTESTVEVKVYFAFYFKFVSS